MQTLNDWRSQAVASKAELLLTVESGSGYDSNVSLFERRQRRCKCLRYLQHRMHPDISAIPKLITYPELIDAKTNTYPPLKGIAEGKRVYLLIIENWKINQMNLIHKQEQFQRQIRTSGYDCWDYTVLLQQGYEPSNLVVLTPYLGQLLKLQTALKNANLEVLIDDMDFNEARNRLEGV